MDQRYGQRAERRGKEAKGKLALARDGEPGAKDEVVERPILTRSHKDLEEVAQRKGGKANGVDLVAPQTLEVKADHPQGKGQPDQAHEQPTVLILFHRTYHFRASIRLRTTTKSAGPLLPEHPRWHHPG